MRTKCALAIAALTLTGCASSPEESFPLLPKALLSVTDVAALYTEHAAVFETARQTATGWPEPPFQRRALRKGRTAMTPQDKAMLASLRRVAPVDDVELLRGPTGTRWFKVIVQSVGGGRMETSIIHSGNGNTNLYNPQSVASLTPCSKVEEREIKAGFGSAAFYCRITDDWIVERRKG